MLNLLSAAVIDLGGTYFAIVDVVFLVVLLIAGIYGAIRGFLKQILSVLGIIAAIIVAILLCQPVTEIITNMIPGITDSIAVEVNAVLGLDALVGSGATKEAIIEALQSTTFPAFTHNLIADLILKYASELEISKTIAGWIVTGVSFVIIFIVSLIVFAIVKKFLKALTKMPIIGTLDVILGSIFSILKTLIVVIVLVILISLVVPDANAILSPTLETGEVVDSYLNQLLTFIMGLGIIKI